MNDLKKSNGQTQITPGEQILFAHQYLKDFINKFEEAERGGIHDFIELSMFKMVRISIYNIDKYLSIGHKEVNANQIMNIVMDSYQKVLDEMKRNLEEMKEVNFR